MTAVVKSDSINRIVPSGSRTWRVWGAAAAALALAGVNSLVNVQPAWANTYEVIDTITVGDQPQGVAVSPGGDFAYVVNTTGNSVSVIQTSTSTVTETIDLGVSHLPVAVAFLPDGSAAYVANSGNSTVDVIRSSDHAVTATVTFGPLFGADPVLEHLAVSPGGSTVYVGDTGTFTVRVIQTIDNSVSAINAQQSPSFLEISPNGSSLYVGQTRALRVIDTSDNSVSGPFSFSSSTMRGMAFSPDGSTGYIANFFEGTVSVIQTSDNSVSETVALAQGLSAIDISPDGSHLYVANQSDNTVSVIQTSDNTVIETITVGAFPRSLAVSPDGSRVYVSNRNDDTVSVIAVTSSDSSDDSGSNSQSGSDSRSSSTDDVPGIFLTVHREERSLSSATEVQFGAFSIQSGSPYVVSIRAGDTLSTQRVLASGRTNSGGHLDRTITLPALPLGSHTVVLSAYNAAGAQLILGNTITVDSTGKITSVTPESQQPNVR